jgi:protein TonB
LLHAAAFGSVAAAAMALAPDVEVHWRRSEASVAARFELGDAPPIARAVLPEPPAVEVEVAGERDFPPSDTDTDVDAADAPAAARDTVVDPVAIEPPPARARATLQPWRLAAQDPPVDPTPPAEADTRVAAAVPAEAAAFVEAVADDAYNRPPKYPFEARHRGEHGTVLLEVSIGADGTVTGVRVATSSGHRRLDRAALVALRSWRFLPARSHGEPVPTRIEFPVVFRLHAPGD